MKNQEAFSAGRLSTTGDKRFQVDFINLINRMPVAVLLLEITDLSGNVAVKLQFANRGFTRMTGYDIGSLADGNTHELKRIVAEEESVRVWNQMAGLRTKKLQEQMCLCFRLTDADGNQLRIQSCSTIYHSNPMGNTFQVISVWTLHDNAALSLDDLKESLRSVLPADKRNRFESLTQTELKILKLMTEGKNECEMALISEVKVSTVKTHRTHIIAKIGAKNSAELCYDAGRYFIFH